MASKNFHRPSADSVEKGLTSQTCTNYCCTICLKPVLSSTNSGNEMMETDGDKMKSRNNDLKRFLTLLERYLNFKVGSSFTAFNFELHLCEDCWKIMDSFSQLIYQIDCLQMKVEWNVWKLRNVMAFANKVPSRVSFFREVFNDEKLIGGVRNWRKNVVERCKWKLSTRCPKVTLERSMKSEPDNTNLNSQVDADYDLMTTTDLNEDEIIKQVLLASELVPMAETCSIMNDSCLKNDVQYEQMEVEASTVFVHCVKPEFDIIGDISDLISSDDKNSTVEESTFLEGKNSSSFSDNCNINSGETAKVTEGWIEQSNNLCPGSKKRIDTGMIENSDVNDSTENPTVQLKLIGCSLRPEDLQHDHKLGEDINTSFEFETLDSNEVPLESCSVHKTEDTQNIGIKENNHDVESIEVEPEPEDAIIISCIDSGNEGSTINTTVTQSNSFTSISKNIKPFQSIYSSSRLRQRFICPKCDKTFSSDSKMSAHLKTHGSNEKGSESESDQDNEKDEDYDLDMNTSLTNKVDIDSDINENSRIGYDDASDTKIEKNETEISERVNNNVENTKAEETIFSDKWRRKEKDEIQTFPCTVCPAKLLCQNSREKHYKLLHDLSNIDPKRVHRCEEDNCSAYFIKPHQFHSHMTKHHNKNGNTLLIPCPVCSLKYFPNRLHNHHKHFHNVEDLDPEKIWICKSDPDQCTAYFRLSFQLSTHIQRCHPKTPKRQLFFQCNICSEKFPQKDFLKHHKLSHHDFKTSDTSKRHHCRYSACHAYFITSQQLNRHIILSHPGKKHVEKTCKICSIKFLRRVHLLNHNKSHHNAEKLKAYKCEQLECSAYFRTWVQLQRHMSVVHKCTSSWTRCKDCGKQYSSRVTLRQHRLNKHFEKLELNIHCSFHACGRRFECEEDMNYHLQHVHTSEHQIEKCCPKCSRKFPTDHSLKSHIKSHERKRLDKLPQFVCEQCGKSFMHKVALNQHYLVHSGPDSWKYQCSTCGKKCMTQQKLEEHNRTHTKEKPFVCQFCGEKYAHKHNLRNHVNSKHTDIAKDVPRAFNKRNLTSRKGIQRKV